MWPATMPKAHVVFIENTTLQNFECMILELHILRILLEVFICNICTRNVENKVCTFLKNLFCVDPVNLSSGATYRKDEGECCAPKENK